MRDHERRTRRSDVPRIPNWLFYIVTLTIVGLWVAGIVISFFSKTFQMPESLNALAPVAVVAVYSGKAVADRRRGDDEDE